MYRGQILSRDIALNQYIQSSNEANLYLVENKLTSINRSKNLIIFFCENLILYLM